MINHLFLQFNNLHSNIFLDIVLLILAGIIGGKLAEMIRLPKVTGYILVGILLGPSVLGLFSRDVIVEFKPFKFFALGLIGYNIGLEVKFQQIKQYSKSVITISAFQIIFSYLLVALFILLFVKEYAWTYALILGAVATVTSPAPVVASIKEYHTHGRLTNLVLPMIAIDDVIGVILFAIALPISVYLAGHTDQVINATELLSQPIYDISLSIVLGFVIGYLIVKGLKYYYKGDSITIFLIILLGLFIGIGLSYMLGTSSILLPLVIGVTITNYLKEDVLQKVRNGTDVLVIPILLIFFTLSGAELDISLIPTIGWIGLIYLVIRTLGKFIGSFLGAKASKEHHKIYKYIGFIMIPQGGVSIDMAILAEIRFVQLATETGNDAYLTIGSTILTVVLGSIIIYKIIGEILVRYSFRHAGEITYEDHESHSHIV